MEGRRLLSLTADASVLVFNSAEQGTAGGGPSHADTLTLTNTGTSVLAIPPGAITLVNDPNAAAEKAASAPGAFAVTNLSSLPSSLAPGASMTLDLQYTASQTGVMFQSALLQVQAGGSTLSLPLHGLSTAGQFGYNQPSLVQILRAFDIPTIVGAGPNDSNYLNSQYPIVPDPSSTEVAMPRLVKAAGGPVTLTPLAAFNASAQPTLRFGYYTPGDPTDTSELFTFARSDAQTVNPTALGATRFDPGAKPFSLYAVFPGISTSTGKPDVHYSEDAFNALDPAHPHKFRFFPLENPDGSVVPNAYIVTAEDFNSTQFNSFVNFVGVIRNVMPATDAVAAPVLGFTNLDGLPSSTRMVFNRIQNGNTLDPAGFVDSVHDTATLQINNSGDRSLVINSLSLSDTTNWQLVNPPAPATAVAPGGTLDVTVKFVAQSVPPNLPFNETNDIATTDGTPVLQAGGVWNGTLTISSNDPVNPARTVQLAGYWQKASEHEMEPGVQTLTNLMLGYGATISNDQRPRYDNNGTTPVLYGEEVNSAYWQVADTSLPVTVLQFEDWSSQFDLSQTPPAPTASQTYWYAQGSSGTLHRLFTRATGDAQMLFPSPSGSPGAPLAASFTSGGAFGFNVDGEFSDASLNLGNTFVQQYHRSGHQFRFYPVRDSSGNLVPNTWLVFFDYAFSPYENYDYQDLGYIVSNMRPATQAAAPSDLFGVGTPAGVSLSWAELPYPNAVTFNVYRASSPNGSYTKLNAAPLSQPGFLDATAPAGAVSYYRVTAVDSVSGIESLASNASAVGATPQQTGVLTSLDIGASQPGSTTTLLDGVDYDVTAGGPAIFGTADGFRFLYETVSGNFDVKVRIASITTDGNIDQAGLMARATLDPSSPDAYVSASPTQGYRFKDRVTAGGVTSGVTTLATMTYPNVWVRLVRSGSTFAGYFGTDGVTWTQVGSITLSLADPVYLGLATAANAPTGTITAQYRWFENTALPVPVASLNASAPNNTRVVLSWPAAAAATSYLIQRKGPNDSSYLTIAQNVTGTTYTDTTVAAGPTYLYRVISQDAAGAAVEASPIASVYVPIPGDINRDGKVDFTDLLLLARNYGKTNATWDDGDFDGDGTVDFSDLLVLARTYGTSGP